MSDKITLNEKVITLEEFEAFKKDELSKMKGVKLREVAPGVYKTVLEG